MSTAKEKAACARRELGWRRHVYPSRVEAGKLTADKAAREIALMQEIAEDYAERAKAEDPQTSLFVMPSHLP